MEEESGGVDAARNVLVLAASACVVPSFWFYSSLLPQFLPFHSSMRQSGTPGVLKASHTNSTLPRLLN